ncbi:hypothetical protein HIF96_08900 [Helcococcus kunzii]|uniref:hypothetical protein n=1 Tax=Helcococcus kunzii TaxID=40091 RepID=UPI001C96E6CA|nr:hypothetical protein [Helcococcus kunzii]QZO76385.1 hypothetical protein HIF96_08900 [Helcococcus kunzii]
MNALLILKLIIEFVFFGLYGYIFYLLAKISRIGGFASNKIKLGVLLIFLVIVLVILIIVKRKMKAKDFQKEPKILKIIKTILFLSITLVYSTSIIHSAIPYNGVLSWRIDSWLNTKSISYEHNNIYKDGIKGTFDDISKKLNLPEELYMSDKLELEFKPDGEITQIYALIYGRDKNDKVQSYLVSYNANKNDKKIIVNINGETNSTYDSDKLISPLYEIINDKNFQNDLKIKANQESITLTYMGKKEFSSAYDLTLISNNADEKKSDEQVLEKLSNGGLIKAYSVLVNSEDYYITNPEYIEAEEVKQNRTDEVLEYIKENKEIWYTDNNNGSVYHFNKDSNKWYKLEITDAALGSYFYKLYHSDDEGKNWEELNDNPFNDKSGVAEGIEFINDKIGFIGMGGASGDVSKIYITKDGGKKFEEIVLPLEKIAEIPNLDIPAEKYRYLSMPVYKNDTLKILVKENRDVEKGIYFESKDMGKSWEMKK